ncbi:phage gp6-like head-tail connector protein [Pseudomonas lundensis]|nr:head-tail connector protein [Pseudomonas lundensis]NNA11380.1 phage gp6-like head-tail connector protein [Pseudomonas lundensis]
MLELSMIKAHLRLDDDSTDEDTLLQAYGRAAWRLVQNKTGRMLIAGDALPDDAPENALLLDDDWRLAMLLLVAHWYEHREAASEAAGMKVLPLAVDALIGPYRWFSL